MLLSISEETNLVISYAKAKDSDVYTCQIGKLFFLPLSIQLFKNMNIETKITLHFT